MLIENKKEHLEDHLGPTEALRLDEIHFKCAKCMITASVHRTVFVSLIVSCIPNLLLSELSDKCVLKISEECFFKHIGQTHFTVLRCQKVLCVQQCGQGL